MAKIPQQRPKPDKQIVIKPLGKKLIKAKPKGQKARLSPVMVWSIDYGVH